MGKIEIPWSEVVNRRKLEQALPLKSNSRRETVTGAIKFRIRYINLGNLKDSSEAVQTVPQTNFIVQVVEVKESEKQDVEEQPTPTTTAVTTAVTNENTNEREEVARDLFAEDEDLALQLQNEMYQEGL